MYLQRKAVVGDIVQRAPGKVPAPHDYNGMLTVKTPVSDTATLPPRVYQEPAV